MHRAQATCGPMDSGICADRDGCGCAGNGAGHRTDALRGFIRIGSSADGLGATIADTGDNVGDGWKQLRCGSDSFIRRA